ncbi:hypothetical protein ACHMW6_18620 [Pseudoduganella sp. UC29_106]|uniref:hypothetical protein n=1 Tax=Pseudoduganella sp. UC29_106 TaxID=3374553 RepID=UPI0037564732
MKTGRKLIDLATELERQVAAKRDLIVPAKMMHSATLESRHCGLVVDEAEGAVRYPLSELACSQLAKKLSIPFTYFKLMREQSPELLDQNINGWLRINAPDSYMVRTLDGRARAFLSTRYRRLDNFDLAMSVMPILKELPGARFESVELTESKLYLKVVSSKLECEVAPGDILQAGVIVSKRDRICRLQRRRHYPSERLDQRGK